MESYHNTTSRVRTPHGPSKPFSTTSGVLQGDTLAPFLFIVMLDYVLRRSLLETDSYSLQSNPPIYLPALAFADDIALLCPTPEAAQSQVTRLHNEAAKVGLRISPSKTEVLHIGLNNPAPIKLPSGEILKTTTDFRYLGIQVLHPDSVFNERYAQAWRVCISLKEIFHSPSIEDSTKARLFRALVESVLMYGLECIPLTTQRGNRIDAAHRRLLRFAFNIQYPVIVSNETLTARSGIEPLTRQLWKQRLKLLAHCFRNDKSSLYFGLPRLPICLALSTAPKTKFRRGMARYVTLRQQLKEDVSKLGLTIEDMALMKKKEFLAVLRSL
jgi:hypothetical protein